MGVVGYGAEIAGLTFFWLGGRVVHPHLHHVRSVYLCQWYLGWPETVTRTGGEDQHPRAAAQGSPQGGEEGRKAGHSRYPHIHISTMV